MPDQTSDQDIAASTSPLAVAAAGFLVQALALGDDPNVVAAELDLLKDDANAAIHSAQLDSSIGPAAFLIYSYLVSVNDAEGRSGAELYDAGIATLTQAAERDTPGPRMVAHASSDTHAFILATTPATWRALHGEPRDGPVATEAALPVASASEEQRGRTAQDLHRALREANDLARQWLASCPPASEQTSVFTEDELALALHVMDDANVRPLLTALNQLITMAQRQAGQTDDPPEA